MSADRSLLIRVAEEDLHVRETQGNNRGPGIEKFWTATSYPDGYKDRAPYCCAAVCWWVAEADRRGVQWLAPLPRDASCAGFRTWAQGQQDNGTAKVFHDSSICHPVPGDIICFLPRFSHIGIVTARRSDGVIETIEANTTSVASSASSERDGGGVYRRTRQPNGTFIRMYVKNERR